MQTIQVPRKLEPVLSSKKRFIVVIGGRGSAKSQTLADIAIARASSAGHRVLCGREFQNSIEDSMYSLIKREIIRLEHPNFSWTKNTIENSNGAQFIFKGLARNIESIKSIDDINLALIEEAQTLSEETIRVLTPSIRAEDSQLIFIGNPRSSEDPFSKRFINPFLSHLQRDGYYEDDLHLIILCNWRDNPFFPTELDKERRHDKDTLSDAMYRHIWEGEHLDEVENSLIKPEWFNACIDAHTKLGITPRGARFVAHDPADTGDDAGGYAARHGILIEEVDEFVNGDGNEGCDWATDKAIDYRADYFIYDADGLGALLRKQIATNFTNIKCHQEPFKGSMSVDNPNAEYQQGEGRTKTNKETFKNKRAQYYVNLKDRIYKTYLAIEKGKYTDPDELISFSSGIKNIDKLRAEICRIPLKPTGTGVIQIMPKPEMKRLGINSPNMADSVKMCLFEPKVTQHKKIEFVSW